MRNSKSEYLFKHIPLFIEHLQISLRQIERMLATPVANSEIV